MLVKRAASVIEGQLGVSGRASHAALIETLARTDVATSRDSLGGRDATPVAELARDIAGAADRGELLLHYQPIQNLRTGECRRVEALLRWQHPRHGLILPGEFLPLVGRLGLLGPIGRWVVAAAFQQAAAWRAEGLGLGIAVNLSSSELASPATLHALVAQLARDTSDSITLEVDATAMARAEISQATLFRLFAAGARVALDDVTAVTAPGGLIANRVDEFKLSRRLVQRASTDKSAEEELRFLVGLARSFHLAVVAVGVEDKATRDVVAALGCDFAQGYWVSHPLLPEKVIPARRWAAGLVLSGALAMTAHVGTTVREPAPAAACASETVRSLLAGSCSIFRTDSDVSALAGELAPVERLERQTGVEFLQQPSSRTSVIADVRVAAGTPSQLANLVDRDITELEHRFGRRFAKPPTVYLFATRSTFALALDRFFGARGSEAGLLAAANGGVAIPRQNAIAINLQNVPNLGNPTIIRHELTHILVREITGPNAVLPAWFEEGLATLEQDRLAPGDGGARANAVSSALLEAQETSLAELTDPAYWTQRNAALDGRAYLVAAAAVRLMENRMSHAGIVRLLTAVGGGRSFEEAYAWESLESLAEFTTEFAERLAASQGDPKIAASPSGGSVIWTVSGFAAETAIAVQIDGRGYRVEYPAKTDRYGVYQAAFGSTSPPGDYVVRVSGRGSTASEILRVGGDGRHANENDPSSNYAGHRK